MSLSFSESSDTGYHWRQPSDSDGQMLSCRTETPTVLFETIPPPLPSYFELLQKFQEKKIETCFLNRTRQILIILSNNTSGIC